MQPIIRLHGTTSHVGRVLPTCRVFALASLIVVGTVFGARATDLFTVRVTIDGKTETRGYANVQEAVRLLQEENLDDVFPNYRNTDDVMATIDFRGLKMAAEFDEGQDKLIFEVPDLDIVEEFYGDTRDEAIEAFRDFMKRGRGDILNRIQRALAARSPVDPIAGNPNSLQSRMVNEAFDGGAFKVGHRLPSNRIGVAAVGSTVKAGEFSGRAITVPLSYTFKFDRDPRMQLRLQLPLSYAEVANAKIYAVAPNIAFTYPVNDRWSLTPALTYGATASIDAGSVAHMIGGTVTSSYRVPLTAGQTLTLGNMVGHIRTLPFKFRGYEFDPRLRNTVLKSGVMLEWPLDAELFGNDELVTQASYAHSYFLGTKLFSKRYHEVALGLGSTLEGSSGTIHDIRLGATYTFGSGYREIGVNVGYSF